MKETYLSLKHLFIICILFPILGISQLPPDRQKKVDSLQLVIQQAKHDSTIVKAWIDWDNIIWRADPDLDFELNENIQKLCEENLKKELNAKERKIFSKCLGFAYNSFGIIYKNRSDYEKAIEYYTKSLELKKKIDDKRGVAASFNNMGFIFQIQGDFATAINYLTESLKIKEELGDSAAIQGSLDNIGGLYRDQGYYEEALEYHKRALEIGVKINNLDGQASCLNNIGMIYQLKDDFNTSLDYYHRSLKIKQELGDLKGMANSYNNIGNNFHQQGQLDKSIKFYNLSLEIEIELNNNAGAATTLTNLGDIYVNKKQFKLAISTLQKAHLLAKKSGSIIEYMLASKGLYKVYKTVGKDEEALEMYEGFIELQDSVNSEANKKEVIRQEYKYEYEKQFAADSVKNEQAQKVKDAELTAEKAQNKQHRIEATQQKQQTYFLFGGLGLALLFGGFIFNRFRITNKQKGIIEEQKEKVDKAFDELEEKNTEIMDSINYAKRIQSAILPPTKVVKQYLEKSFILYKPKDIVAGDFYWMEHRDNKVLFAAADCTGHGVPGAMVSVICNNGLNRSVREHGLTEPGKILDKTREIVIQEFEKSEEEVKDGMDIALCSLEFVSSSFKQEEQGTHFDSAQYDGGQGTVAKLQYAGAHNPLWIIRNGPDGYREVLETKANKEPIGKFDKQTPYITHTFELEKGDSIYIFSDGYVDQFGGEKGKKFKSKAFRNLLLSIQEKTMEEQRLLIDEAFENWRGSLEQIDDVCVIGVRI